MRTRRWLLNTMTAAILATLGACGGGGGDDGASGPTIDISTVEPRHCGACHRRRRLGLDARRDGAAGNGFVRIHPVDGGLAADAERAAGKRSRRSASAAMAVIGPIVEPCQVSGSVTVTWDDADNSGLPQRR